MLTHRKFRVTLYTRLYFKWGHLSASPWVLFAICDYVLQCCWSTYLMVNSGVYETLWASIGSWHKIIRWITVLSVISYSPECVMWCKTYTRANWTTDWLPRSGHAVWLPCHPVSIGAIHERLSIFRSIATIYRPKLCTQLVGNANVWVSGKNNILRCSNGELKQYRRGIGCLDLGPIDSGMNP